MSNTTTCFMPNITNNQSVEKRKRLIEENGFDVVSIRQCIKRPSLFLKCKIFNLNWFENVDTRFVYYKRLAFLRLLRLFGKRIVYTVHNKKPHNAKGDIWPTKMMKTLCRKSNAIIGFCPETKDVVRDLDPESLSKLVIIPHENYISEYQNVRITDLRTKYAIPSEDTVFLFLGFIAPYKNLEKIIDIFKTVSNKNVWLLIAGRPVDEEYGESLKSLIGKTDHIITDMRYIPEEEVPSFYNAVDIVILPYKKETSLNSGVVYLSFSLKKTVVTSEIGSIKAMKERDFIYSYDYVDENEHPEKLREAIMRALNDQEKDRNIIREKGHQAFEYVKKYHDDELIGKAYGDLYRRLIK